MTEVTLPKTYKAAVYDEPGKVSTKVVEKDLPEPAAGDVLIKLYVRAGAVIQTSGVTHRKLTSSKHPFGGLPQ